MHLISFDSIKKKVSLFLVIVMIVGSIPFSSMGTQGEWEGEPITDFNSEEGIGFPSATDLGLSSETGLSLSSETGLSLSSATDLSLFSELGDTGATAIFDNPTSASVNVMLILAVYDQNNRMVSAFTHEITAGADSTVRHLFPYDVAAHQEYIYRVFAWDPVSFAPLTVESVAKLDVFEITDVEVINERVAIVHLSNEIGTHFEQYALARSNYLTYYLKLDGEYLHNNREVTVGTSSRIYIREDKKSFELVLGSSTGAYSGNVFKNEGGTLQFDFKGRTFIPYYHIHDDNQQAQSGDVWVRDVNDRAMTESIVSYEAGTYGAAPGLAVEEMRVLDSRAVYVRFNQRIILSENAAGQNMTGTVSLLNRAYAGGSTIGTVYRLTSGDTNLDASYSYGIDRGHPLGTVGDNREFIIYYNGDFVAGSTYAYNWTSAEIKGLINAASSGSPIAGSVTAPATVSVSDFNLLSAELTEFKSGKFEIELTFDRPFAYTRIADDSRYRTVNQANNVGGWANKLYDVIDAGQPDVVGNRRYYQALFETGTGMCGTVLTADDLKEILTFSGVKAGGVDFLDAFPGDAVLGSFKDSHTIVINNNNRLAVTLDAGATVSIKAGALVGYGTRGSWTTATVTNPGLTNGTVGVINGRTNGPRNSAIAGTTITKVARAVPFPTDYDEGWNKGVTVTESVVKFGHNDVYYLQYDGKKDPLVGGFDPRVRFSTGISNHTQYAPDGKSFTGSGTAAGSNELKYVVQSTYPSVVLENKYVKATIVPAQAARFLYFIFKPTGHDAFYTNPAATNYNIQNNTHSYPPATLGGGTFVLGWLFVWGGTFPVFDGCEHGQIWTTGFDYEIKEYPDGSKSVICKLKNDQDTQLSSGGFVPNSSNINIGSNYTPFGTGLEYTIEYKLANDSPVVDMVVSVYNPAQVSRTYEYYTCNTYAPGEVSEWGHGSMKHIDPVQVLQHQGYSQMVTVNTGEPSNDRSTTDVLVYSNQNYTDAQVEAVLPQSVRDRMFAGLGSSRSASTGSVNRAEFYKYDTMRYMVNHSNSTNFANDLNRLPQADWEGAVNLSRLEGVLRTGPDLKKATPGIKYWIWNYRQMFDNIPFEWDSGNSGRPYLEPWPAAGNQYFQNRALDAGATHNWVESYYHTFGIDMATNATPDAAALLKFYETSGAFVPTAEIYTTKLEKTVTAVFKRDDTSAVLATQTFTQRIMAHEVINGAQIPQNVKVVLELYEGSAATGTPFFTAWAISPLYDSGASKWVGDIRGQRPEPDRTSAVSQVVISHKGSIDIPGRAATGDQYRVREVFAYCEPFSADGFMTAVWSKESGDVDEVLLTSGVNSNGVVNNTGSTWWHSFDYITLRGNTPGSSVVLRATAKDTNVIGPKPYAELTVNVKKPLYLKLPNNPGNSIGSTNTYAQNMYSPYKFNLDMALSLEISKHDLDTIDSPVYVEIWDRNNELASSYIRFDNLVVGANALLVPANTLPSEGYYKIVARTVNGDALGYEYFRVDGYSEIDWSTMITQDGANLNVRFLKKNSTQAGSLLLDAGAVAYVNGTACSISVGTSTSGATSNANTIIISGGYSSTNAGNNEIRIEGIMLPDYPGQVFNKDYVYAR